MTFHMSMPMFVLSLAGCAPTLNLTDDSQAENIAQQLIAHSVSTRSLDLDRDGLVVPLEVRGYAIDHFDAHSQIAQEVYGGPLPFIFPDGSPYIKNVKDAVAEFKRIKGDAPRIGDSTYYEQLSVALYYFTQFPRDLSHVSAYYGLSYNNIGELDELGLGDFREWLEVHGGLGGSEFQQPTGEFSASESLDKLEGWCTQSSKVFYAVSHAAGLIGAGVKIKFVTSHSSGPVLERFYRLSNGRNSSGITNYHVYLEFDFAPNHIRYFDLALSNSNADYPVEVRYSLLHFLGVNESNKGMYGESDIIHARAVRFAPNDTSVHVNYGVHLRAQGNIVGANGEFEDALKCDPNNEVALGNLISNLMDLKRLDEAYEYIQKLLSQNPDNPKAYFLLGNYYFYKQDYSKAVENYKVALRLDSDQYQALMNLANVYEILGDFNQAMACVVNAGRLDFFNPEPYRRGSHLAHKLGNNLLAFKFYKALINNGQIKSTAGDHYMYSAVCLQLQFEIDDDKKNVDVSALEGVDLMQEASKQIALAFQEDPDLPDDINLRQMIRKRMNEGGWSGG